MAKLNAPQRSAKEQFDRQAEHYDKQWSSWSEESLRWLLENGFRASWPATLMTKGPYQKPVGAFLPSIAF